MAAATPIRAAETDCCCITGGPAIPVVILPPAITGCCMMGFSGKALG